jgi:hypothetical protein
LTTASTVKNFTFPILEFRNNQFPVQKVRECAELRRTAAAARHRHRRTDECREAKKTDLKHPANLNAVLVSEKTRLQGEDGHPVAEHTTQKGRQGATPRVAPLLWRPRQRAANLLYAHHGAAVMRSRFWRVWLRDRPTQTQKPVPPPLRETQYSNRLKRQIRLVAKAKARGCR